eukprot:m51a1_g1643 hypothetical protein (439) ;mRNA; f:329786-331471
MLVVVFNCGSSSLSYSVYDVSPRAGAAPACVASGKAHRVACAGTSAPFIEHRAASCGPQGSASASASAAVRDQRPGVCASHGAAAAAILEHLAGAGVRVRAAGHRFAHGGSLVTSPGVVRPFAQQRERLVRCVPLAPIHNRACVEVIDVCREKLGDVPQYYVLDSAFHAETLEPRAYTYALPSEICKKGGYRRYGFHGLSYQYVTEQLSDFLGGSLAGTRLVACHLGTGGSSAAAIVEGRSVDSSFGWSSWSGLVMSTRTGDVDAGVALSLVADHGMTPAAVADLFTNKSGLTALTGGLTSDLRDVYAVAHDASDARDPAQRAACALAWDVYVHKLVGYVAQLAASMDGVNCLLFTDDLGFDMPQLREAACSRLAWMGVRLDAAANSACCRASLAGGCPLAEITGAGSAVRVFVVLNDEQIVIAREAVKQLPSDFWNE